MKVIGWMADVSRNCSLEHCWLVNKFAAEKLGSFESARITLYGLGFNETESNEVVGILPGREQK
jgi:hypothetical protein